MLTAQEIKDMSSLILDYQSVQASNSQTTMKNQIPSTIKNDEFLRDALVSTHTILNSYITEYKLICGHIKDNYTKVTTQYEYQGTKYSDNEVYDLQEAIDAAFFNNINNNNLPVGNLFFHTTEDWDNKGSVSAEPNESPDLRNDFPVGNTRYKYDEWWPDANSKLYKPYYYLNERNILSDLIDAITVYSNGLTSIDSTDITLTTYEPVIRYLDGTIPPSTINWSGTNVEMYGIQTLFQPTGTTCNYSNNQLGLARDGNGSGSNYFIVKLLEKFPYTNVAAPYYFKYKEISRNANNPTGNIVIYFTSVASGNVAIESMITALIESWKDVINDNTENIINTILLNTEKLTNDTIAYTNANNTLTIINNWLTSGTKFASGTLATLLNDINTRDTYLQTRMTQISNTLIAYKDSFYEERKDIIYWRVNKKEGRLTKLADLCKGGYSGEQVEVNNEEQYTYMKRRMIVKKLHSDGDGSLYFTTPISSDEDTYGFSVNSEVYLISDKSTNQFMSSAIGKYKIISIQEKTVDSVSQDATSKEKVRVKYYKTNKIISQTLLTKDNARAVQVLPPFDD